MILHVAGVLLHTFVHRDGIALGMVDGKKSAPEEDGLKKGSPLAAFAFVAASVLFFASLLFNFNPANRSTRWPISGQVIQLGENESGSEDKGEGDERAGEPDGDED